MPACLPIRYPRCPAPGNLAPGYLALVLLVLAGCITPAPPPPLEPPPAGAPAAEAILHDLAAFDGRVQGFTATATVLIESPELAAIQLLRQSSVAWRRPDALHLIGRKYGTTVARLTSAGPAFLLEFPTERTYFHELEGAQFEDVPFSVAPADIATEMFVPEPWRSLRPRALRVLVYDPATQRATFEVWTGAERARRRCVVEGPPWRLVENVRLDEDGRALARTTYADYRELDGVLFPGEVDARFPRQATRMRFQFRRIELNPTHEAGLFDVAARTDEVARRLREEFGIGEGGQPIEATP